MEPENIYQQTREQLSHWQQQLKDNIFLADDDLAHSINFYFPDNLTLLDELQAFAHRVADELEPKACENNLDENLPKLQDYNAIGEVCNTVQHHPSYQQAGDIIYSSKLLARLAKPGGLLEALSFLLLSSHAGEAGHNCPIACSAGVIRIFQKTADFPQKAYFLQKLIEPSFTNNFTGAQFLTEIQGGSDVGANATKAHQDERGDWIIEGEKWFCSNANADLMLLTARFDESTTGTKGLGLFLIPASLEDGSRNHFHIRRLKDKIGTRSMATGEIDFNGAKAIAMGEVEQGIHLVLENVLHLSRLFNAFSVLGMARRAHQIAYYYAQNRDSFGSKISHYPLVQEQLAKIKVSNTALIAATFAIAKCQDEFDVSKSNDANQKLLLRLLVNLNKYYTAKNTVENIRHCVDILAGNGTIESFSTLPCLLRDSVVCENWEGTHYTLWMQILRDIHKYKVDEIFIKHIKEELTTLKSPERYNKPIETALQDLQQQLQDLKQSSEQLQTLIMQSIVAKMAGIYSAVCLLKEALDQQQTTDQSSKLTCFELFCLIHLTEKSIGFDENYFKQINKVR